MELRKCNGGTKGRAGAAARARLQDVGLLRGERRQDGGEDGRVQRQQRALGVRDKAGQPAQRGRADAVVGAIAA